MKAKFRAWCGIVAGLAALGFLFALLTWETIPAAYAAEPPAVDFKAAEPVTDTQTAPSTPIDLFFDAPTSAALPRLPSATTERARLVQIRPEAQIALAGAALQGELSLQVSLFPDARYTVQFNQIVPNASGSLSWVGQLSDDPLSQVIFTVREGMLYGTIISPAGVFEISPFTKELYVIREIDQSGFAETPEDTLAVPATTLTNQPARSVLPQTDNGSVIDVLVAYTDDARAAAGSRAAIELQIETAVNSANQSYQASGVTPRVRLAAMIEVGYAETMSSSIDLDNVTNGAAGLQIVRNLRDTYAADVVTLITEQSNAGNCGLGWLMETVSNDFAPRAYNVATRDCMNTNQSMVHEWGHNMGARHDWFVDTGNRTSPYSYAHGYVLTPTLASPWRTIMAYNNRCTAAGTDCTRIARWSNPNMISGTHRMGVPAGTSTNCTAGNITNQQCDADDRLALNNTASTVANFEPGNLSNVYVNTVCTWAGGVCVELGTSAFPFDSVTEGVYRAAPNTTVWLAPGAYAETAVLVNQTPRRLIINRPMLLQVNGSGTVVIGP